MNNDGDNGMHETVGAIVEEDNEEEYDSDFDNEGNIKEFQGVGAYG